MTSDLNTLSQTVFSIGVTRNVPCQYLVKILGAVKQIF